jgi:flotillin
MNREDITTAAIVGGVLGLGALCASRYHIAAPSTYLVRTGLFIKSPRISGSCIRWPLQRVDTIHMAPMPFKVNLEKAMSEEKIEFSLPGVFIVGVHDSPASLEKYTKRMVGISKEKMDQTITGAIHGTCRIQAGTMKLDDIFNKRAAFQQNVITAINEDLQKFGLEIHSANLEELQDAPGNDYFKYVKRRALEGALNTARVDVAAAKKRGDIGEAQAVSETRLQTAEWESKAVVAENTRKLEIARSSTALEVAKAEYKRQILVAEIESAAAGEIKTAELQKDIEAKRHQQQIEHHRAGQLAKTIVEAESVEKKAHGEATAIRTLAEAKLFEQECQARGIRQTMTAQADGLKAMILSAGGSVNDLTKYLMIRENVYEKLAVANAQAIKGLNPKYTIWQQAGKDSVAKDPIQSILSTLPPLLATLKEQTGYDILPGLFVPPGSEHKTNGPATEGLTRERRDAIMHDLTKLISPTTTRTGGEPLITRSQLMSVMTQAELNSFGIEFIGVCETDPKVEVAGETTYYRLDALNELLARS